MNRVREWIPAVEVAEVARLRANFARVPEALRLRLRSLPESLVAPLGITLSDTLPLVLVARPGIFVSRLKLHDGMRRTDQSQSGDNEANDKSNRGHNRVTASPCFSVPFGSGCRPRSARRPLVLFAARKACGVVRCLPGR